MDNHLKKQYEESAESYRLALCFMWEIRIADTYWIADEVGGTLDINCGFLTISMTELRYIVDNTLSMEEVGEWYDHNTSVLYIKEYLTTISLESWHHGAPHVDARSWDEQMMRMSIGGKEARR